MARHEIGSPQPTYFLLPCRSHAIPFARKPWKEIEATLSGCNVCGLTTLYLARHTFATDIMTETGNIFVTKEIMGHASTATLTKCQHPVLAEMADAIIARNVRNAEESDHEKVRIKLQSELCTEEGA